MTKGCQFLFASRTSEWVTYLTLESILKELLYKKRKNGHL